MRTLVCRQCGRTTLANKKLKHLIQYYCGDLVCQKARKLSFERNKYRFNGPFRSNKLQQTRERKNSQRGRGNPFVGSEYQRSYRATHPEYVLENRHQQQQRNQQKRCKTSIKPKIVNPDTLIAKQIDNDMVYAMIAVDYKKIVNPDALMSQLAGMESITKAKTMFVRRL
jgi:hypothetical protein